MAAPINTTLPYALRNQLIPVFRSGNFAGPGYAGRLGAETVIEHPSINNGKPILTSELTRTPQGLASFMNWCRQIYLCASLFSVMRKIWMLGKIEPH